MEEQALQEIKRGHIMVVTSIIDIYQTNPIQELSKNLSSHTIRLA